MFALQKNTMDHIVTETASIEETDLLKQQKSADQLFDQHFKPKGAFAFFLILIILGMIIWYGIYFLMLERI